MSNLIRPEKKIHFDKIDSGIKHFMLSEPTANKDVDIEFIKPRFTGKISEKDMNLEFRKPSAPEPSGFDILDYIGFAPLVKLKKIPAKYGVKCEIYAKCEYMSPAGSSKDRIAQWMMADAVKKGAVHPDTHFVEPSSGNTGLSVAYCAALRGNKCTIVTNMKTSEEKINAIKLMGANVIQIKSPLEEPLMRMAEELKDQDPNHVVMLEQFENEVNPTSHYLATGKEILKDLPKVDMAVMTEGTGGTITGVGYRLKESNPDCIIVCGEPEGSTRVKQNAPFHPFLVEGIGGKAGDAPIVFDMSIIDDVEMVSDEDSFHMARELCRTEGLLCGGSSGLAVMAAINAIKKRNLDADKKVVVVLPDGIRNYMTKFVSEQWMEANLFQDPPEHTMKWWKDDFKNLDLSKHNYKTVEENSTCKDAIKEMEPEDLAVVIDKDGTLVGAVSKNELRYFATNPTKLPGQDSVDFNFDDPVSEHLVRNLFTLAVNGKKGSPTVGLLSRVLDITPFVVIGHNEKVNGNDKFKPDYVAKGEDLLDYIQKKS